jgi:hypothetical protein
MERPNKTTQERIKRNKELIIEQFQKTPVVQIACEKTGIGRATYYRWCQQDKVFHARAVQALKDGIQMINDMAESQLLGAIRDKDMAAIKFWLKHHHPIYSTKIELTSTEQPDNELTSNQKAILKKALEMVAFKRDTNEYTRDPDSAK